MRLHKCSVKCTRRVESGIATRRVVPFVKARKFFKNPPRLGARHEATRSTRFYSPPWRWIRERERKKKRNRKKKGKEKTFGIVRWFDCIERRRENEKLFNRTRKRYDSFLFYGLFVLLFLFFPLLTRKNVSKVVDAILLDFIFLRKGQKLTTIFLISEWFFFFLSFE